MTVSWCTEASRMNLFPIGFLEFGILDLIEVSIIALSIIYIYRWIRGSFAVPVFLGLAVVFLLNAAVSALGFSTIQFVVRSITNVGILALLIIFQPEIRKLLYNIGQNSTFDRLFNRPEDGSVIDEVVDAVRQMTKTRTGALIVFAKTATLHDLVNTGVRIDARVNSKLLQTIFSKDTPLHDGAVIIRNDRITSASAYLPISQNPSLSDTAGTRHRAALGVTEGNNVFVIVVSEESGRISVARDGMLSSGLSIQALRQDMMKHLAEPTSDEESVRFGPSDV